MQGSCRDAKECRLEEVTPELSHVTVGALALPCFGAEGLVQRALVGALEVQVLTPTHRVSLFLWVPFLLGEASRLAMTPIVPMDYVF